MAERHTSASVVPGPRCPSRTEMNRRRVGAARFCMIAFVILLFVHVYLYALASDSGYERAKLTARLSDLRAENAALRARVEYLRSPQRLASVAQKEHMVIADRYERVVLGPSVKMAKAVH